MAEEDKWRIARIALDTIGSRHGYVLAGGLALHAHGVTDRPVHDIDLFALPGADGTAAHVEVVSALTEAGYDVQTLRTTPNGSEVHLQVRDPHQPEGVELQLVQIMMDFEPSHIGGYPVMAIEDCIHSKGEALRTRLSAKDFVDLHFLDLTYGVNFVDAHLGTARNLDDDLSLSLMLSQVGDIPDESFARYNLPPDDAAYLRYNILAWASDLVPPHHNELQVSNTGPAVGTQALDLEQATQAWERIAANEPVSLLTDYELTARFVSASADADIAAEIGHVTSEEVEATGPRSALADAFQKHVDRATAQEYQLHDEIYRRLTQPGDDRAAEVAVRRAIKGLHANHQALTQDAVLSRVTAAPSQGHNSSVLGEEASKPAKALEPPSSDSWGL
ncbi:hypothetical protein GCM10010411_76110 [Actinomadura fulvescens]|uniref:Uncharacterized protein n=1 Tax=Actinomadura fulvescens TaxID=46160 RepID=A0ABN3QIW3_9ACTN